VTSPTLVATAQALVADDNSLLADRFDVYYAMADDRIGVARLEVPEHLPPAGAPSSPEVTRTGATSP
jgi:hypothetical protein